MNQLLSETYFRKIDHSKFVKMNYAEEFICDTVVTLKQIQNNNYYLTISQFYTNMANLFFDQIDFFERKFFNSIDDKNLWSSPSLLTF